MRSGTESPSPGLVDNSCIDTSIESVSLGMRSFLLTSPSTGPTGTTSDFCLERLNYKMALQNCLLKLRR